MAKIMPTSSDEQKIDEELEHELVYHLSTIPTGISSPKVLKSILINHRNTSLEKIKRTLRLSKCIIKNEKTGKWMLKRFLYNEKDDKEPSIDEELKNLDCIKSSDDEIIC